MPDKYEVVSIKVPKKFVRNGFDLVIDKKKDGDCIISHLSLTSKDEHLCLIARPRKAKPDWNPPKIITKGWLTWDKESGWFWWSKKPEYIGVETAWILDRCDFEEIGEIMAKFLDFPDCNEYDEKHCIWEVGGSSCG